MAFENLNYDHSLLSLVSSVLNYYGAEINHRTLPLIDRLLKKNYKNVIVMLFDGMGTAILEKHLPEDAFLRRNQIDAISSVFPPTTTAATITLDSGLSPIEHGWLGWSLYFAEIGNNISIFPNTISGSGGLPAAEYNVARRYLTYNSIFEKINSVSDGKIKAACVSPFSEYRSKSIDEICNTVLSLCADKECRYIYTYWAQPDSDIHEFGTADQKITEHIVEINSKVKKLADNLSDTLLIVTADHGLVDVEWRFLSDYPDIMRCLERMPSIETRAMSFFIKEGNHHLFEEAFEKHFGDYYLLLNKDKVLSLDLFGTGTPNPRALSFIGNYLAAATGNVAIDIAPSDCMMKASHAGITADEFNVPLIVIEKSK